MATHYRTARGAAGNHRRARPHPTAVAPIPHRIPQPAGWRYPPRQWWPLPDQRAPSNRLVGALITPECLLHGLQRRGIRRLAADTRCLRRSNAARTALESAPSAHSGLIIRAYVPNNVAIAADTSSPAGNRNPPPSMSRPPCSPPDRDPSPVKPWTLPQRFRCCDHIWRQCGSDHRARQHLLKDRSKTLTRVILLFSQSRRCLFPRSFRPPSRSRGVD